MNNDNADVGRLIRRFGLRPHPEGGYYAETFRSRERVSRVSSSEERAASTAIYYLLNDGAFSAWHRIASDEMWHFHAGTSLNIHVLDPDGQAHAFRLGDSLLDDTATYQVLVPAGRWFAAELADPASFAFVGCTVAPGFEFHEFELATREQLADFHPGDPTLIERLLAPGPADSA